MTINLLLQRYKQVILLNVHRFFSFFLGLNLPTSLTVFLVHLKVLAMVLSLWPMALDIVENSQNRVQRILILAQVYGFW